MIDRANIIQDSSFLYDHSNLMKKYFITVLKKFLSVYDGISYFCEKRTIIDIVNHKSRLEISIGNISYKESLILLLTKVSRKTH